MLTYERTLIPETSRPYGYGATSEVYRSPDGHEVKLLPGREWIDITLPDGRTAHVLSRFDSSGRELVPFARQSIEEARPFAEALVAAIGGRIEEWTTIARERRLEVILSKAPFPPLSLSETDPHDEDE